MVTAYDVTANELISATRAELMKVKEIQPPVWAKFVKTGVQAQRPPTQKDWWHTRCAALLRTIYIKGPVGVQKLRTKYGGSKKIGCGKAHFRRAGGNIIRKALQQLEAAELIKKASGNKGREISPKGKSMLDKLATKIAGKK